MDDFPDFMGNFEFSSRRAITEAGPQRAAYWYDSADNNEDEDEQLTLSGEFFDLN
jgi:hypothetical protein